MRNAILLELLYIRVQKANSFPNLITSFRSNSTAETHLEYFPTLSVPKSHYFSSITECVCAESAFDFTLPTVNRK